ncbi:hypothetical protein PR003_g12942 [Phytophthora rubi]|uniref:Uncharacterized protein n=1 Tax=Phytophthora rubi TaxID=129364 RepID=A0A6A3LQA2_9STRA|nr:hypothetical protein PR001_g13590 [Phytophthora rubi]KAE9021511.1 hypothetical protein PR002_g12234 [Phytophthora rubi]KAE9335583.1 hypothetical protein PR003_g12942 [Phytophthora rubi]
MVVSSSQSSTIIALFFCGGSHSFIFFLQSYANHRGLCATSRPSCHSAGAEHQCHLSFHGTPTKPPIS